MLARVASGLERKFAENISADPDRQAYVPVITQTQYMQRRRRWLTMTRPLLPCYVFFTGAALASSRALDAVLPRAYAHLIRLGDGRPATLPETEIFRLRMIEREETPPDPRDFYLRFTRDSIHVVRHGLMDGKDAVCVRAPRKKDKSAPFLVEGRQTTIPLYLFA